jgi:hypothetical protein
MKKGEGLKEIECGFCGKWHRFTSPVKSFVCQQCGVAQNIILPKAVGYSHKRNYPEGFWV